MRIISSICLVIGCYLFPLDTFADESDTGPEILAKRGEGIVSQQAFSARADKIPAELRLETLRDTNRLKDLLNSMLLQAQLAHEARESGFDQESLIINRMHLAAEGELAAAWLQHYVDMQPHADFEQIAQEKYQLNKKKMLTSAKINVSHILVSSKRRDEDEAESLANSIYQQLEKNPASFDELIIEYSEDSGVSSNHGHFIGVRRGEMVKPFEETAFALKAGEISKPVRTTYGYHIIRLDAHIVPEPVKFETAKNRLMATARKEHEARIRRDYLTTLTALNVNMKEEALQEMVRRQFGEEYIGSEDSEQN